MVRLLACLHISANHVLNLAVHAEMQDGLLEDSNDYATKKLRDHLK